MKPPNYRLILKRLPEGLSQREVAARLGINSQHARKLILRYNYNFVDGRKYGQRTKRKLDPDIVDWTKSNVEIAKKFGVSRERVRAVRKQIGKPFVESRGRPVKECTCGTQCCQRRDC